MRLQKAVSNDPLYNKNIYPAYVDNKRKGMGQVCSSLDDLLYVFACTTDKSSSQFPLTEDAFQHHLLRAEY